MFALNISLKKLGGCAKPYLKLWIQKLQKSKDNLTLFPPLKILILDFFGGWVILYKQGKQRKTTLIIDHLYQSIQYNFY